MAKHDWKLISPGGTPGLTYRCRICGVFDDVGAHWMDAELTADELMRIKLRKDCPGYPKRKQYAYL
jgi:hypothetical protein